MNSFDQIARPIVRKFLLLLLLSSLFILSLVPCVLNSINIVSYIDRFIGRKAMFLFCNAILLFIVCDSGLLLPPSVTDLDVDELPVIKGSENHSRNDGEAVKEISITVIPNKLVSEQSIKSSATVEEKVLKPLKSVEVAKVSEELKIHNVISIEPIEEELEVDEFNRRCEEFIEKIKRARQMETGRRIEIK